MNDRLTSLGLTLRVALVASALIALPASAQAAGARDRRIRPRTDEPRDPPPPLPASVLKDQKLIAAGEALWKENCAHCHGSKAYPGKAPKLQPTQVQAGIRLGPRAQRLQGHAALEGALQPRAGHFARRLGDERGLLAVRWRIANGEQRIEACRLAIRHSLLASSRCYRSLVMVQITPDFGTV